MLFFFSFFFFDAVFLKVGFQLLSTYYVLGKCTAPTRSHPERKQSVRRPQTSCRPACAQRPHLWHVPDGSECRADKRPASAGRPHMLQTPHLLEQAHCSSTDKKSDFLTA